MSQKGVLKSILCKIETGSEELGKCEKWMLILRSATGD